MQQLSISERWHSKRNQVFHWLRNIVQFRRKGYGENFDNSSPLDESFIAAGYLTQLKEIREQLSPQIYRKNLSTLFTLEGIFADLDLGHEKLQDVLEVGAHDFSRLPALRIFFRARITGLEIDPFPILHDLHSRFDRAEYYQKVLKKICALAHSYLAGDFFTHQSSYDLVLCFYPFVSPHPSLAWGLSAELGSAQKWRTSLERCVKPGGLVLLVHQGEWEQETFDEVRDAETLQLLARKVIQPPFESFPYPPHVSLYRRRRLCGGNSWKIED